MNNLSEAVRVPWTKELFRVYKQYPSAIRSKKWPEIARLANSGDVEGAKELAKGLQKLPAFRRSNIIARRIRVERVALFTRMNKMDAEIKAAYAEAANVLSLWVEKKATSEANVPFLIKKVDRITTDLRVATQTIIISTVRDCMRLGIKAMGDAMAPIFKAAKEEAEDKPMGIFLSEAPLNIGLSSTIASIADPRVRLRSAKWNAITTSLVAKITRGRVAGLKLSERLWEIATDSRLSLKREIISGVSQGKNPSVVANKIKKYLQPVAADGGVASVRRGMYKSPYKNAMRIARTETARAYGWGQAEYAKDKSWVQGVRWTISKAHLDPDICDDYAAQGIMTPDEFQDKYPAHPHCFCYPEIVPLDKYLENPELDKLFEGEAVHAVR